MNINILNSKIDQLNNEGDNVKIERNSAPVNVAGIDAVQTIGGENLVQTNKKEESFILKIVELIKKCWRWLIGRN